MVALLDEELAACLAQVPDDVKFGLRDLEPANVVVMIGAGIGQVDLRDALLDNGLSDGGVQDVRG